MINQLILNGIIAGSVYILVAVGFAVIYRTVRFFILLMVLFLPQGLILHIYSRPGLVGLLSLLLLYQSVYAPCSVFL